MRRSRIALGAGAALLLAAPVLWFLSTHDRAERTVRVGPKAPARLNRYLAAERFLTRMGLPTRSAMALTQMPDTDTTLVWLAGPGQRPERMDSLRAWCRRGGHLVWAWDRRSGGGDRREARTPPPWLEGNEDAEEAVLNDPAVSTDLAVSTHLAGAASDTTAPYWRTRRLGTGLVTVVTSPLWFDNDHIGLDKNASHLWAAVQGAHRRERALLVVWPDAPNLLALLWRHGWPLWLSLAGLIAAWGWRASRSFGPPLAAALPIRRSLLEHIGASGFMLWRIGQKERLLDSARTLLLTDLAARLPATFELPAAERDAAIAEASSLPVHTVRAAMHTPRPIEKRNFINAMRAIDQLRSHR